MKNETSVKAYGRVRGDLNDLIARINKAQGDSTLDCFSADWGDIGDISRVNEILSQAVGILESISRHKAA